MLLDGDVCVMTIVLRMILVPIAMIGADFLICKFYAKNHIFVATDVDFHIFTKENSSRTVTKEPAPRQVSGNKFSCILSFNMYSNFR